MFDTQIDRIIEKIETIDPVAYGRTRNFHDGAVTRLSPYISRGVISTAFVLKQILKQGRRFHEIEKFVMELAWRDYFQNIWRIKGDQIDDDLSGPQPDVAGHQIPSAVLRAETGIEAIDRAINDLYETGYVHNHLRMYIASVTCNVAKCHWKLPAKWFYFHLRDADWASNALSWQWTAASFSSKKYYANQENINKYSGTDQHGSFLDVDYSAFAEMEIPDILKPSESPELVSLLPASAPLKIDESRPTLVYNFYNLDPFWHSETDANRVLLLEPAHFARYPVSGKSLDFVSRLAENIPGLQTFTGDFDSLAERTGGSEVRFKKHPTAAHYRGTSEHREWMFPSVRGYFPSFFGYWKKCEKIVKQMK
jgi:deoxyribodipyrimidine photo-lyase